jgi:ABC-2 type transport system permease protein
MGAKRTVSHSLRIAWKDLLDLTRNKMALAMLVLMPLLMMLMVGYIFPTTGSINHLQVGLVNSDAGYNNDTSASRAFVAQLEAIDNRTGMMELTSATSFADIKTKIQDGDIYGGIIIPENFSSNLMTGKQATITIVTDQSNPQISTTMQSVLTQTIDQMGIWLAQQNVQRLDPSLGVDNSLAVIKPYNVQTEGVVPGNPNYFQFMAPGIIAMVVMMSLMTGLPHAISHEREVGTLDGMMVAPVNRLSILLGKTIAQIARGIIQGVIILVLAMILFGVTIQGSIPLVFALLFLGVFSFVGLGIIITAFAKTEETAGMIMMTLMFPMMFLSGVFFPIQQMPWFMQDISKVLPLTYVASALRKVMTLGAGIPAIATELAVLIGFGVIMIMIAVPVFKRAMTR